MNFDNNSVKQLRLQNHLGFHLDSKMDFREHLKNMFQKVNKKISFLCALLT